MPIILLYVRGGDIKMKSVVPRLLVLKRNSTYMLTNNKTYCIGWCIVSKEK